MFRRASPCHSKYTIVRSITIDVDALFKEDFELWRPCENDRALSYHTASHRLLVPRSQDFKANLVDTCIDTQLYLVKGAS